MYETADQCTSTTDPLRCGWCQGRSCMTELECLESGSTEWYPHAPPPNILSVSVIYGYRVSLFLEICRYFLCVKIRETFLSLAKDDNI